MRHALLFCLGTFVATGCMRLPEADDPNSGVDGKRKGATRIELEDGNAKERGIVTSPGGDRVDWKKIELSGSGDLVVELDYTPPRPGLDVSVSVHDAKGKTIAKAGPKNKRG